MKVTPTALPGVLLLEPQIHRDARGFFLESWREDLGSFGIGPHFVQDNHSRSVQGALRGLHYQLEKPQGKLVRVAFGEVFDVAVDLRRSSPTFGQWVAACLSDANHHQLWIPPGFGHGFYVLSHTADLLYKCTEYYAGELDRSVQWNDPDLAIRWPLLDSAPLLSAKDAAAPRLRETQTYP
ncbi:MAG TPA: dTDP-4-dehydrorhamnose 3,5-epimerase [Gemmatimonadales bacterium]|nr:dTDP-4-dehydrorhamnose 3,5-epimerase [Gemmatimonadales bacterium]